MRNAVVNTLELLRLWNKGVPADQICATLGLTHTRLMQLARAGNFKGWQKLIKKRTGLSTPLPTRREIAERAAVIRRQWSPAERERRAIGLRRSRVTLKAFALSRDFSFDEIHY